MQLPKSMTYGEGAKIINSAATREEAQEIWDALVSRQMKHYGRTRCRAEEIEKSNVLYLADSGALIRDVLPWEEGE